MSRAALYICYDRVEEPLVQAQVVAYLRELARRGYTMHLLTFERETHSASREESIRLDLAESGITWHHLRYHRRPSLPATLYDIALGTLEAWRICRTHRIRVIHARSHVPAAMALSLRSLLGARFLFDMRGLLAEEYVDGGNWKAGGVKFRLVKRMERAFFRRADQFVMLTHSIKDRLTRDEPALSGRADDITVIPCCVDTDRFRIDPERRAAYRVARGWGGRRVLTYIGKVGTWYLVDEMVRFSAAARGAIPGLFLQVLTQSDPAPVREALRAAGVPPEDHDIRYARPAELPLILCSSDASISLRKGESSKWAASPTKVGESLAAGLALVTSTGIGDCDRILTENRLGVVLQDFTDAELRRAAVALGALLHDPDLPRRCRAFAVRDLSLRSVGGPRYHSIYERLFNFIRNAEICAEYLG